MCHTGRWLLSLNSRPVRVQDSRRAVKKLPARVLGRPAVSSSSACGVAAVKVLDASLTTGCSNVRSGENADYHSRAAGNVDVDFLWSRYCSHRQHPACTHEPAPGAPTNHHRREHLEPRQRRLTTMHLLKPAGEKPSFSLSPIGTRPQRTSLLP